MKSFQRNNDNIRKLFEDTSIDKEVLLNKYREELKDELNESFAGHLDYENLMDIEFEKNQEFYDLINQAIALHKFQYLIILCQTWENQLVSFITKEIKYSYKVEGHAEYGEIINFLKDIVREENIRGLDKLTELRKLINVIKHGDGRAANALRKKRPDYFHSEYEMLDISHLDSLKIWDSIYISPLALNVKNEEFYQYYNAINEFWDSFPERVYYDYDIIEKHFKIGDLS